jgi:hypothetical protein
MGKAINGFINRSAENDSRVIKLTIIDFYQKDGSREKTVVKEKNKRPHESVVTKIREVTYLYNKKTTRGWEIVEEQMVPREIARTVVPEVVGEIVRDLRTKEKDIVSEYNDR